MTSEPVRGPAQPDDTRSYASWGALSGVMNWLATGWNFAVRLGSTLFVSGTSQLNGNVGVGAAPAGNVAVEVYSAIAANANALGVDVSPTITTQNTENVIAERVGGTLTLAATTNSTVAGLQVNTFTGTATAGATSTYLKQVEVVGQIAITNWTPADVWGLFVNVAATGTNKFVAMLKGGSTGIGTITSDRPTATLHVGQVATGTTSEKVVGIAGSTVNLTEWDASAITNAQKIVIDKDGHAAISQAAVPTAVAGTGFGTVTAGPTLTGTDQSGKITITTSTGGTVTSTALTVTFKTAMTTAPNAVIIAPANNATQQLPVTSTMFVSATSTTTFTTTSTTTTAIPAGTYAWWYWVI